RRFVRTVCTTGSACVRSDRLRAAERNNLTAARGLFLHLLPNHYTSDASLFVAQHRRRETAAVLTDLLEPMHGAARISAVVWMPFVPTRTADRGIAHCVSKRVAHFCLRVSPTRITRTAHNHDPTNPNRDADDDKTVRCTDRG